MSTRPYRVKSGDHLVKIAYLHGASAEDLWNHPANQELAAQRNPSVLLPGDIVHVPPTDQEAAPLDIGSHNAFTAEVPSVAVDVAFQDDTRKPLQDRTLWIHGLGEPYSTTIGKDGLLHLEVPVLVSHVTVVFEDPVLVVHLEIGHLDPLLHASGTSQRLGNLAFADDALHFSDGGGRPPPPDDDAIGRARGELSRFQEAAGLKPTGHFDPATTELLYKWHGC